MKKVLVSIALLAMLFSTGSGASQPGSAQSNAAGQTPVTTNN